MPSPLVSVITGAARGIGAATAKKLAVRGHCLVINYLRSEHEATQLASECSKLGAEVLLCRTDLSQRSGCETLINVALARWSKINYLINNAGTTVFAPDFNNLVAQADHFDPILRTNLLAPYYLAMLAAPHMPEGSAIVNVASNAGITGIGSSIPYAVSKGALMTLTLSLAKSLSNLGIRVNAVCPSVVDSSWWEERFKDKPEQLFAFRQKQREASPIQQLLTPEQVAEAILYQLDSSYLTGECMRLDAGVHLGANPPQKIHPRH